jgi:rSAM/selenodomain-associated transferase 1
MKPVRIVIFAKAPQPGFAKTRLIPSLGAQGAADLARRLLIHTVRTALAAKVGPVELCVTPSAEPAIWQSLAIADAVQWSEQGEGDLGDRLSRATQRIIAGGESVLLIGTDCPDLSAIYLKQAARALQSNDATLFPAFDGGYVLLGLNRFHESLFSGIAWSTKTVAVDTLCRLEQLRWAVQNHQMLHDIDEPIDLKWLPRTWLETPAYVSSNVRDGY